MESSGEYFSPNLKNRKIHPENISYIISENVVLIFQGMKLSSPKIKKCQ